MSKKITPQEIMEMAVHKREPDMAADMNKDGRITPEDARLAPDGVEVSDAAETMSQELLDRLMSTQEYGYDYNADPLYRQYKEMYENAGSRAAENAYGLASAFTGGYGSSYASTVANDAYALYMDKLAAKGAELEQKAYDRAQDSRADLYRLFSAAKAYEDGQYDRERDLKEDAYREGELALKEQEAERSRLNDLIAFAFDAAGKGDYRYLAAVGIDPAALEEKDALDKAAFYAKYGDWSELDKLGVDLTALTEQKEQDNAAFYAKYGDLSGLAAQGVDVSQLKKEQLFDIAALFAKYGNFSLLKMLI